MTVKNTKDALRILRLISNTFDLVITDVHMPEMNGFQFQQQIIKEFDIPIACEFLILYILQNIYS